MQPLEPQGRACTPALRPICPNPPGPPCWMHVRANGLWRPRFARRPIRNWVARLFASKELAQQATYHADEGRRRRGFPANWVADIYDGAAYKALAQSPFGGDERNIFVAFVTDGLQPFVDDSRYAVWPLVLTPLNFPPELRCVHARV